MIGVGPHGKGGGGGSPSPLTTKGDLYTYDVADQRLPVGTDGYVVRANSGVAVGLSWGQLCADDILAAWSLSCTPTPASMEVGDTTEVDLAMVYNRPANPTPTVNDGLAGVPTNMGVAFPFSTAPAPYNALHVGADLGALTGVVTFTTGSTAVTAVGGAFLVEVAIGDYVKLDTDTHWIRVSGIINNDSMTLERNYVDAGGAGASHVAWRYGKIVENQYFTFTVTGKEVGGLVTKSASSSLWFLPRLYYGNSADPGGVYNEAFIEGLASSALSNVRQRTIAFNTAAGEYEFYAYLTSYGGAASNFIDLATGFAAAYTKVATGVAVTNAFGIALTFDVWRSNNAALGVRNIQVT